NNLRQENFFFDRAVLHFKAHDGVATLDSGEAITGQNKLSLKGSAELPPHINEFGRSPATVEFTGSLPDLQSITARFPQPLTGAATVTGNAEIRDAVLRAELSFSGGPIASANGSAAKVTGTVKASKQMPPAGVARIYYADLHSQIHLDM